LRTPLRFASSASFGLLAILASAAACTDLRLAELPPEAGASASDAAGDLDGGGGADGQASGDATKDAPSGPKLYDDVQAALEAKRFPGPTTAQGSKGYCTSKSLVWRESDGTLHSWAGKTQAKIDYGFKAGGTRPYFVPSDSFIAVDVLPGNTGIDVYRTDMASTKVTSLAYAFNFVAANDGIIRLDQVVNGTDVGGTKVRRWNSATMATEDVIPTVLSTREPPSSFGNDLLVIPGGITIPFPLLLVDVVKKTTGSVTFDGALTLSQTEQFASGLAVAYVRNGASGAALRIYKDDHDDAASRFELGDELANRAAYFADSPNPLEHKFLAHVTTWNQKVLYASAYGIWSYDMVTGSLAPVQLVAAKKTAVPDIMCVLRDENLLVYRMTNDVVGQVWAVPLGGVLQ
jgi:hypothetical protein